MAANLPPRTVGNRAWLVITPIIREDAERQKLNSWEWSESILSGNQSDEAITGYRIVRIEMSEQTLDIVRDDNLPDNAVIVEKQIVSTETELNEAIRKWIDDASLLRHPGNIPDTSLVLFRLGKRAI